MKKIFGFVAFAILLLFLYKCSRRYRGAGNTDNSDRTAPTLLSTVPDNSSVDIAITTDNIPSFLVKLWTMIH